ncbi:hypothetical protein BpHYR1_013560 [Brachionus plicatilis]|uniref:Uncharacterized protein n=1 Tax=Brachionus plicatilis TaxID=10195 RepID=A0A3M7T839_BRAPC|nr:hypothetical protein BpHYR1_013560 [Brachionus plicatilis]
MFGLKAYCHISRVLKSEKLIPGLKQALTTSDQGLLEKSLNLLNENIAKLNTNVSKISDDNSQLRG